MKKCDGWIGLSAAIIENACNDYITAYIRNNKVGMKECMDFFKSSWFDELCGTVEINKPYFYRTLEIRGEYDKWRKAHKCASRKCHNCIHYKGGEWQKWHDGSVGCVKEGKIKLAKPKNEKTNKVINLTTGEVFESIMDACEQCGISKSYLYGAIKNRKPVKGNMWSYYKIE